MKVLLIQSYTKNLNPIFPTGIACIISSIKDRHDIVVFDPNAGIRAKRALAEIIEEHNPDVVGISLRNVDSVDYLGRQYFYPDFVDFLRLIKSARPKARIIAGGSGFSLFANEIMNDRSEIDIGVFLEGEETFPEALDNLDSPQKVKGLFFRNNGKVIFNGQREPVNFQNLPGPSYEYFDLKKYREIGIESKRGCYLKCLYCPYPFLNGQNVRFRSPKTIADEIESLSSKYGIREFSFVDSVFNIPEGHSKDICREIISRGLDIKWSCWTNERMFTEEYARLARDAGCRMFPFSTDAFSDESLTILGKNYRKRDILKTVEVAKKVEGINISYGFFMGPPGSTTKDFFQTLWFLLKAKMLLKKKLHGILAIKSKIRIEPHTRMRDVAIREGVITADTNLLMPVYYTNPSTRRIEFIYGMILLPVDFLIRLRRWIRRALRYILLKWRFNYAKKKQVLGMGI